MSMSGLISFNPNRAGGSPRPPLRFFGHNSGYGYAIISNEPSKFRFLSYGFCPFYLILKFRPCGAIEPSKNKKFQMSQPCVNLIFNFKSTLLLFRDKLAQIWAGTCYAKSSQLANATDIMSKFPLELELWPKTLNRALRGRSKRVRSLRANRTR